MPSTVASVFKAAGLKRAAVARWGQRVPPPATVRSTGPSTGIYIVALTPKASRLGGALANAPIAQTALEVLLARRGELTLDGSRPTVLQLQRRLARFWLPDEVVIYIGLADTRKDRAGRELPERAHDYTRTRLGAKALTLADGSS